MQPPIFQLQQNADKRQQIDQILDKYQSTKDWQTSRQAFGKIVKQYLHGGLSEMSEADLDQHFRRALIITKQDVEHYQNWASQLLANKKDLNSPYYIVNTAHHRGDHFFATDEARPITGTGDQTLNAKFEAHNIYEKFAINAQSPMPPRVADSPFPTWTSIVDTMTNEAQFQKTFALSDPEQEASLFAVVSAWNWDEVQGELFLTPDMAFNQVFSPALFAVYFFSTASDPTNKVFLIVSADGNGTPTAPFVGLVNPADKPQQQTYSSTSRFAFTYLSSTDNPMRYWIDDLGAEAGEQIRFNLTIETFFPDHPKTPYIEVITEFCAQVPEADIGFYKDVPFFKTFLMLIKGTLMRDLIKAYYPNSSSVELWIAVGALQKGHPILNELAAIGLDALADIFDLFVWKEKPTVVGAQADQTTALLQTQTEDWQNWHRTQNVGGPVQQVFEPDNGPDQKDKNIQDEAFQPGLQALLKLVEQAMQQEGQPRIRAFGSKWSLNNAAYTKDYMVKTWGLNYAKIGLAPSMVTSAYVDKANLLCFVQTGVMIHYLNEVLYEHNLALKTTGASDGQRLIGAIATGTHGSAMNFGAMQDYVKGIHLVLPDGDAGAKHVFLQRKSDQAVNASFAGFLDNTVLLDDDALFNAVVVGFGCFGLIHGLLIETEPLFQLKYQTVKFNPHLDWYKDKLQAVQANPTRANIRALAKPYVSGDLFHWLEGPADGYPYFFSVTRNPYKGIFPRTFFVEVMEKVPYTPQQDRMTAQESFIRPHEKHEATHAGIASQLMGGLELTTSQLSDGIQIGLESFHHFESMIPSVASRKAPGINFPNVIFHTKSATNPSTKAPTPATSTEIAVPLAHANQAINCILDVLQTHLLAAPLGIRYIPASQAPLAVNQYEGITVTIELPGPEKGKGIFSLIPDAEAAHAAIFQALDAQGIPHRFHWGQQYPMNNTWVPQSYPEAQISAWKAARVQLLPSTKAQHLFANDMTDAIGLT